MMILTRTLCIVALIVLAYVIFSKPREIVTEAPSPQVSAPQPTAPPLKPKPQPQAQPRPKRLTADVTTVEPENQPALRSLQPTAAQSVAPAQSVAAGNQPIFRPLQSMPAQSQSFAAYGHALGTVKTSGKPVEVWGGSNDELTIRLKEALKDALRSAAEFHLSAGKEPNTLVITLPSNVGSKQISGRTQVLYTAEFASDGHSLGGSAGSCWGDALAKCAAQIVAPCDNRLDSNGSISIKGEPAHSQGSLRARVLVWGAHGLLLQSLPKTIEIPSDKLRRQGDGCEPYDHVHVDAEATGSLVRVAQRASDDMSPISHAPGAWHPEYHPHSQGKTTSD